MGKAYLVTYEIQPLRALFYADIEADTEELAADKVMKALGGTCNNQGS